MKFLSLILCSLYLVDVQPLQADDAKPAITEPLLEALLTFESDRGWLFEESSDFFCTLAALNAHQDCNVSGFSKGRAFTITAEKRTYVIAILGTVPISIPGSDVQKILLYDKNGKLHDHLACGINSRYGHLLTGGRHLDDHDSARLVIRFIPNYKSNWHNWHTITHADKSYTFRAEGKKEPVDWVNLGLIRIAIRGGKFQVLFPDLTKPDAKVPPE